MAGRPPKPTALKVIAGTFRQDRANNEPVAEAMKTSPRPPKHFRDHSIARREWRRISPLLIDQGTLSEVDLVALECYCLAYERALEAEAIITARRKKIEQAHESGAENDEMASRSALTFFSPNGYEQQIPEVSIAQQARKECREFLIQFGMTPASRSRINIQKKPPKTIDPMEALLARR